MELTVWLPAGGTITLGMLVLHLLGLEYLWTVLWEDANVQSKPPVHASRSVITSCIRSHMQTCRRDMQYARHRIRSVCAIFSITLKRL